MIITFISTVITGVVAVRQVSIVHDQYLPRRLYQREDCCTIKMCKNSIDNITSIEGVEGLKIQMGISPCLEESLRSV